MQSVWNDQDAASYIDTYAATGEDLALRIYSSHLIGRDSSLVMHGGGNTSVKSDYTNILGEQVLALFVKGSGWNLDSIEVAGFPGLDLNYLLRLRALDSMTDEQMVNQLRTHMFDATAPNPSVETLLHAFIPKKFVDHSHADAILTLTNQTKGWEIINDLFGSRLAIVPYTMPGFALSKMAADAFAAFPDCEGILLDRHGLFTFADTAKESYQKHIEFVTMAEDYSQGKLSGKTLFACNYESQENPEANAATAAMILRGLIAEAQDTPNISYKRMILHYRCSDEILAFANSEQASVLCATGPLTPDHIIRTKETAVYIDSPDYSNPEQLALQLNIAIEKFQQDYHAYFTEQSTAKNRQLTQLDPLPRVFILPGAGLFTAGKSRKDAMIAADIYEHTIAVKSRVQAFGNYNALSQADLFDVEYWSLEQAKLGKATEKSLSRQVAVITGAGGAIGQGIATQLANAGAHLALLDIDLESAQATADKINARFGAVADAFHCDVTKRDSVETCFDQINLAFGGFDILVPNAGIAYSAAIENIDPKKLAQVMDVNFTGYFNVIQTASIRLKQQGTGGNIIINSSKNVFAPGKEFSAYSASKAAGHQLGKIAAMELAAYQIKVNMINADAVFAHGDVQSGLWQEVAPERATARGLELDELFDFYRNRNLLKAHVLAEHVGNAVVYFASDQSPSTGVTLPVDGGIPEAFPR